MATKINRIDYSKVSGKYPLPNLIEVQLQSFKWFRETGVREVFKDVFPIESNNGNLLLEFIDCNFEDGKRTAREAKDRDSTYASSLKVKLRLTNRQTGLSVESEVFMGDFPRMTTSGTFIINGAERVIVSQLVRSPGAYFRKELDKNGKFSYHGDIIPSRGTWLEYESDSKDIIGVRIDRTRKLNATILFKALGIIGDENILSLFGPHPLLVSTLKKDEAIKSSRDAMIEIFNKIRVGEIPTEEGSKTLLIQKFFDSKRYDLASAGRFKVNKKLSLYSRLLNRTLAEDLFDLKGNLLFKKGTVIDNEKMEIIEELKVFDITKNIISDAKEIKIYSKDTKVNKVYDFNFFEDEVDSLINHVLSENIMDKDGNVVFAQGIDIDTGVIEALKNIPIGDIENTTFKVRAKPQDITKNKIIILNAYNSDDYKNLLGMTVAEDLFSKHGELLVEAKTTIDEKAIKKLKKADFLINFNIPHRLRIDANLELDNHTYVQRIKVYNSNEVLDEEKTSYLIAPECEKDVKYVTIADMVGTFSYFLNILDGFGNFDDIDNLGNRRIRSVGELIQNQFRVGLARVERTIREKMSLADANVTAKELINIRPLMASIKEFFSSSQLSQFMDQTNPLAELTNKRRLSALGPGGLSRDRAGFDVRDVHYTHYGRICPIETPEGPNIGLINNLATYAKINEYGFIETPYRKVDKKNFIVTSQVDYLSADRESEYVIAQANIRLDDQNHILDDHIVARFHGENVLAKRENVDYVDVSPKQIVSVATACIPFLENDDSNRALMGANMQRQAVPLLRPHAPIVGTGMEYIAARDSGAAVVAEEDGIVEFIDAKVITLNSAGVRHNYPLLKFARSNHGTCISQVPLVKIGEKIKQGEIIADGPAMEKGDLALGQNVVVAFMTWNGYNYEDAVIMSERLVKEDVYTSLHIEEYDCECRETKLGSEEITKDIPNLPDEAKAHLDARGIVIPGTEVRESDILVGKLTPKGLSEPTPEEKLLMSIFGEKSKEGKDNSLRVPHGGAGTVLGVKIFRREEDDLQPGVNEIVRVFIVQKRKISEGDKMAGRHGNKGVISKILPIEDMPYLADGTPVDIMLNPLGVPSRMNIGQILEIHLGMAAQKLGLHIATPVFDGVSNQELFDLMEKAGLDKDGKTHLYDGRTGEIFEEKISLGVMYMIKLAHMVDDKLHARATGPYSLVTQQPLGGKAQNGGQRFGEMEVWALEAYGAAHTLQEIDTIKSDDMIGRAKTYEAIIKGKSIPKPGIPESFKVLQKEFQSLAIDIKLLDDQGGEIDMQELSKQNQREERKIAQSIREVTSQEHVDVNDAGNLYEDIME